MRAKKIFWITIACLCSAIIGYFSCHYYRNFQEAQRQKTLFQHRRVAWKDLKQTVENEISRFKGEVGIVIKDLGMNWEISFNKDKLFPSASLAKIPIMAACFLAGQEGRLKLDYNITLKSRDKLTGSGMLAYTQIGTTFSIEELIGLMIYDSDNTATNLLTNALGIDYLNNSFKAFGLKSTALSRKVADYKARDRGIENYTTAQDMSLILEKIYDKTLVNRELSEKCLKLMKLTRMNDRISAYLPAEAMIVHKTGLERGVCHDVGIVFTPKGDFLICVLTKHSETTSKAAKELIAKAAFYTYQYFTE